MTVQARFFVDEVSHKAYNPEHTVVTLRAANRGEENKEWAEATPFAEVKMTIGNPAAAAFFSARLGQDVAVTFEETGPARYATPYQADPSPESP